MSMSIPYTATGRTKQKARTRDAILAATRSLLASGVMPTVEQAADEAGVARATAYRYFPNQRDLMVAVYAWIDEPSLLPPGAGDDPETRLTSVVEQITEMVAGDEMTLRAMLRLSLEPGARERDDLALRQGRRIRWVRDALAPLEDAMPAAELERTVLAVAAVIGIESLVWLKDRAGLATDDAIAIMRSSALTLLRAATEGTRRS